MATEQPPTARRMYDAQSAWRKMTNEQRADFIGQIPSVELIAALLCDERFIRHIDPILLIGALAPPCENVLATRKETP